MAKTALFSRLTRLVGAALASSGLAASLGRASAGAQTGMRTGMGRREVLLGAAASGAALLGCDAQPESPVDPDPVPPGSVAIVGGGLAGLHCAYWLAQAEVDVVVYEANTRLGGRTFTGRGYLPDRLSGEFGGEFIDSDHIAMRFLARELGVILDDRDGEGEARPAVFWVRGGDVPEARLAEELASVLPALIATLERAEADPQALDTTPLSLWLAANVPSQLALFSVMTTAFRVEFGLETEQQSALNLIHLVAPDADRFEPHGDRRYRARDGSDAFAGRIASVLGERVKLDSELVAARTKANGYTLTLATSTGFGFEADAARVVFALPFSVLRRLNLTGIGLSPEKRRVIGELGYGTGVKTVGAFATRIWRELYDKSGSVTSDLAFQEVWDSSSGEVDPRGVLSNLAGGDAGLSSDARSADATMAALLVDLDAIFPGVRDAFLPGSAFRVHWPTAPLFRGSTSCRRHGQWADAALPGEPEGNLYFCGEHCSIDFPGRMEGAAETGALTAARILDELGHALPDALADLLDPKLVVPQPCYPVAGAPSVGLLTRRRLIAESHAEFARQF